MSLFLWVRFSALTLLTDVFKACEVTWKQQQATTSGRNNLRASSSLYRHLVAALGKYGIFQATEKPEEDRR